MLAGAWGALGAEQLARTAGGTAIHREGELAMLSPPDAVAGPWRCWMFGTPRDLGRLGERFGLTNGGELSATFARALGEIGDEAFDLLSGSFAVVAHDQASGRCLVARDQLGEQPLVYARLSEGVVFAEHERDLLSLLPWTPGPDRLALAQWIGNGTCPPGHTLFDGIGRVPPGHHLGLKGSAVEVERWWQLRFRGTEDGNINALAESLREATFAAVERASAGSQLTAVKLSGGLDSACVAAGLAARSDASGRTLALGGIFPEEPETDERALIEANAGYTETPLELIPFSPTSSILTPALEHIARWRLPPATPNLFVWRPLMARARELGVDVMLDGEGGDELFGLAPQLISDELRLGHLTAAWSLAGQIPDSEASHRAQLRALRNYGVSPIVPPAIRHRRELGRAGSAGSILQARDARALLELHIAAEKEGRDGPAWWRSLVASLIDARDGFDMAGHFRRGDVDEQVPRHHPFIYDLQLTEAVLRIPPAAQFDRRRDRPLLREALRGHIPEQVRTRHEKSHFTPLVLEGIRGEEAGIIEPLRHPAAPVRAFVAHDALERRLALDPGERPVAGAGSIWRIGIANRWLMAEEGRTQPPPPVR